MIENKFRIVENQFLILQNEFQIFIISNFLILKISFHISEKN